MILRNIGPDDRSIPAAKVVIPSGATGDVPEAIAREFVQDEPTRWKIADEKKQPKADKA